MWDKGLFFYTPKNGRWQRPLHHPPKHQTMEVNTMKKNNTVKKILSAALSLSVMLSLAACGGEKTPTDTQCSGPAGTATYKVGI